MPSIAELGRKVKAKYPGAYDDIPDDELGRKVKAKYPGSYDDFSENDVSQKAAANKAKIEAGGDIPPGVDLETPKDPSYGERVKNRVDRSSAAIDKDLTKPLNRKAGGRSALGDAAMRAMGIVGNYGTALLAPATAAVEKGVRRANPNVAGPEAEQVAVGSGDLADMVLQNVLGLGLGKKGLKYEKKPPKIAPVETEPELAIADDIPEDVVSEPIYTEQVPEELGLVEDPDSGDLVKPNPKPTPDRVEKYELQLAEEGVDPSDLDAVDTAISQKEGVPKATKITVGETPVSKTTIDGDTVNIDLAEGTADELAHEKKHQVAEVKGTPHPPEDNNAILDAELAKGPTTPGNAFVGKKMEIRGQQVDVISHNPETKSYVVRGQKTGSEFNIPARAVEGGVVTGGTTVPKPAPYVPDPSLDVDYAAASGPYPKRGASAPENTFGFGEPAPAKDGIRNTPEIDKSIVGPMEESIIYDEPLPDQLGPPPEKKTNPGGINNSPNTRSGIVGPKEAAANGPLPEQLGSGKQPRIPRGPNIDKRVMGPKENALLGDESLPADLDTVSGGEDVARVERNRAAKLAQQARIRDQAKSTSSSASRPDSTKTVVDAEAKSLHEKIPGFFNQSIELLNIARTARPITTMRNVIGGGMAALTDGLSSSISRSIQRTMGKSGAELTPSANGVWKRLFTSARQDRNTWRMIEELTPEAGELLERYMGQDAANMRFTNPTVKKLADVMSWTNNLQEGWFRTGAAMDYLEQVAKHKAGVGVQDLIARGDFNKVISKDDLAGAIFRGRENTFSLNAQSDYARRALSVGQIPLVKAVSPFMRFRYNAVRYLYNHSPLVVPELGYKVFDKGFTAAVNAGDPKAIKKLSDAMVGTMMLGAGYLGARAMTDQDSLAVMAEKVNIKPNNPFAAYLTVGWLWRRGVDHDPLPLFKRDKNWLYEAILSYGTRDEIGGVVDSLMKDLLDSAQKGNLSEQKIRESIGKYIASYTSLGKAINNLGAAFDPELAIQRDTSRSVWDPTIANIPFLSKTLPKRYGTDYAGPVKTRLPVASELGGTSFEGQGDPVNREMELMQVHPVYNPFPGYPEYNNAYRKLVMEHIRDNGNSILQSPGYKKANPYMKNEMLKNFSSKMSALAKATIKADMPEEIRRSLDPKTKLLMGE